MVESYASERVKVLSVWSEFRDEDLPVRPRSDDSRGRGVHEHMVHQCVSEDAWFRTMLDIDMGVSPLPQRECRVEFMKRYAEDSARRLASLGETDDGWWEAETTVFDVRRSKAWVMTRRLNHTSHHRGQQMAMLRMLGRELHSNYGPTADTGGLMQNHAPTILRLCERRRAPQGRDSRPGEITATRRGGQERHRKAAAERLDGLQRRVDSRRLNIRHRDSWIGNG